MCIQAAGDRAGAASCPAAYTDDVDSRRAWIKYTVIRLLAVVVPFAVVMLLLPGMRWNWAIALVVATITGAAVSVIFLRNERAAIGEAILESRTHVQPPAAPGKDAAAEDALLDGVGAEAATAEDAAVADTADAPAAADAATQDAAAQDSAADAASEDAAPEAARADAAPDTPDTPAAPDARQHP